MSGTTEKWKPLVKDKLSAIEATFKKIFPENECGDLARQVSDYWIEELQRVWKNKSQKIKEMDKRYTPSDPLSRIEQKTVVITYADSVRRMEERTLTTLDGFLQKYFPAIRGIHMLPACVVNENRFNDGYFSQVVRHKIHESFGTNRQFEKMMETNFSMADFVLNHVDIDNPMFQAYLSGDDDAGQCFYVFKEKEFQAKQADCDFDQIFRPRPFPLFTIFRRKPKDHVFAKMTFGEKVARLKDDSHLNKLDVPVIGLLSVFGKIKNDQMLLSEDYQHIVDFRKYLEKETSIHPDDIFQISTTQETQHPPFVFHDSIEKISDLLEAMDFPSDTAQEYARTYDKHDPIVFGEPIRALTTFSHVQVDLNTTSFQGLKMLADDFSWYLSTDLNMLRLDAANYAFKRWKSTCFGLPEVKGLLKILYLSMDCVAPRIVANLEVNDMLSQVLNQMAEKTAPPPMMYDFHLASMLPVVFNTQNAEILLRIFKMISQYDIPKESIRFSLAESHDGKSVRGSLDLLTLSERQCLADTVETNGGKVKYKSVQSRRYTDEEFMEVCKEAHMDMISAKKALFQDEISTDAILHLREEIRSESDIANAIKLSIDELKDNGTLKYFVNKLLFGKEPYELCTSTRDSLIKLRDSHLGSDNESNVVPQITIDRYLAFYTLAFALMGRNVKSVYFNDLLGLPNDYVRYQTSGELRDLKRTKSDFDQLQKLLDDPATIQHQIATGLNNLIALVDSDPSFHYRGNEAEAYVAEIGHAFRSVSIIHTACDGKHTLILINVGDKDQSVTITPRKFGLAQSDFLFDNISGKEIPIDGEGQLNRLLYPYQRLWLTLEKVEILDNMLIGSNL